MNEILSTVIALTVLISAFAGLVAWVRRDTLTVTRSQRPADLDVAERDEGPATKRSPARRAQHVGSLQVSRP